MGDYHGNRLIIAQGIKPRGQGLLSIIHISLDRIQWPSGPFRLGAQCKLARQYASCVCIVCLGPMLGHSIYPSISPPPPLYSLSYLPVPTQTYLPCTIPDDGSLKFDSRTELTFVTHIYKQPSALSGVGLSYII